MVDFVHPSMRMGVMKSPMKRLLASLTEGDLIYLSSRREYYAHEYSHEAIKVSGVHPITTSSQGGYGYGTYTPPSNQTKNHGVLLTADGLVCFPDDAQAFIERDNGRNCLIASNYNVRRDVVSYSFAHILIEKAAPLIPT